MAMDIVKDGKAKAKIYAVPEESRAEIFTLKQAYGNILEFRSPAEIEAERLELRTALCDLVDHVEAITGARLEVVPVTSPEAIAGPAIVIGTLAQQCGIAVERTDRFGEAFRIETEGDRLYLSGAGQCGTAYAIYELLERLGCDWVLPGPTGMVLPSTPDLTVGELAVQSKPSFEFRAPWYSVPGSDELNHEFRLWKLRKKLQLEVFTHPMAIHGNGHAWGQVVTDYREEFEADPEMYALVLQPDGSLKRMGPQIEIANPKAVKMVARYIRDTFTRHHWPQDREVSISIGPADGAGFSQSPESRLLTPEAIDSTTGSPDFIEPLIVMANDLLEQLTPEYPNLHLGLFLYSWHAGFPTRVKPHPHLTIDIADISYSRYHGLSSPYSKTRPYYKRILEQWGELFRKQGNTMIFRGYNWNLANNLLPYTKLKIWGEDYPFYHALGVIGAYTEYSREWAITGPSDYLEAELLWDVTQDYRDVLKDYCRKAFGAAAPEMEAYYRMLAKHQEEAGMEAGSYWATPFLFDRAFLARAEAFFIAAAERELTGAQQERLRIARLPLQTLDLYLTMYEAYSEFEFERAAACLQTLKDFVTREIERNPQSLCPYSLVYLDVFWNNFMEASVKYSTGSHRIVYRLPERLPVLLDPFDEGDKLNFFRPEINDRELLTLHTYRSTWDQQGLGAYLRGSTWYRHRFTPEAGETEFGLFVGGADSIVEVWCNGEPAGEFVGAFLQPAVFDLTGKLRPGEENQLTIRVRRAGLSELGMGGLFLPSFIFSGRPDGVKAENVPVLLPGGGLG